MRDETGWTFSHAPPGLSPTGSGIALFAVRFTSRSSFLFLRFSLLLSRACSPLLILRSCFRLSFSRASARNLPREYSRVDTNSARTHSLATLFFLTFPYARSRRRRRRRENVLASLPAMFLRTTIERYRRYRREFMPQNTTAESYQWWSLETVQFFSNLSAFNITITHDINLYKFLSYFRKYI